jgi:hypothetical protein
MATHLTRVANTPEEQYYDLAVTKVRLPNVFGKKAFERIKFFHSTKTQWYQLVRGMPKSSYPHDQTEAVTLEEDSLYQQFSLYRMQAIEGYEQILSFKPSLFIFGCPHETMRHIGRHLTDKSGRNEVLDIFLSELGRQFEKFFSDQTAVLFKSDSDMTALPTISSFDFGGFRALAERSHNANYVPSAIREEADDFRDIPIPIVSDADEIVKKYFQYRLRWFRNPQDWTYTFIESIREGVDPPLDVYKGFLLTALLHPHIRDARAIAIPEDVERPNAKVGFPGALLSGAHYLNLPLRYLLAACSSRPDELGWNDQDDVVSLLHHFRRIEDPATNKPGEKITSAYRKFAEAILTAMSNTDALRQRRIMVADLVATCTKGLSAQDMSLIIDDSSLSNTEKNELKHSLKTHMVDKVYWPTSSVVEFLRIAFIDAKRAPVMFRFLEKIVQSNVARQDISDSDRMDVLQRIAELTRLFWEFAFQRDVDRKIRDISRDYVCSGLWNGRCLYFSNFVPVEPDQFTQTIFVDVGMTPFERGRTLQRLCDISTYRSVPIRDLDRVYAAISGLNECNRDLNKIQASIDAYLAEAGTKVSALVPSIEKSRLRKKIASRLDLQLRKVVDVSDTVNRMNSFLTYGIPGKWFSSKAYIEQIRERCNDIQEIRIPRYASLGDYVERRMAHAMRFVERMYMLHQSVTTSISGLMDRVRTQLYVLQTQAINKNLDEQVILTKSAEIFLYLAGTYYLSQLMLTIVDTPFVIIFSLAIVVGLVYCTKRYLVDDKE